MIRAASGSAFHQPAAAFTAWVYLPDHATYPGIPDYRFTWSVMTWALGIAWNLAWPGSPSGAFAMVCAAAMIGAAMQAPLSGLALVPELTHSGFGLMVPMMAATGIATRRAAGQRQGHRL
jgi:Voltage gated chloride channel